MTGSLLRTNTLFGPRLNFPGTFGPIHATADDIDTNPSFLHNEDTATTSPAEMSSEHTL